MTDRIIFGVLACSFLGLTSLSDLAAQSPPYQTIAFQGFLTDDLGDPLNDPVDITFSFYLHEFDFYGDAYWRETHQNVSVNDGVFNVNLGSITPMDNLSFDIGYYVGIRVGTDPEMTPREPLRAVAYAMSLGGGFRVGPVVSSSDAANVIGGISLAVDNVVGVAVGGGGNRSGLNTFHIAYGNYGTIGGGWGNLVGGNRTTSTVPTDHPYATVGGGKDNEAFGTYSTIPGGYLNRANGRLSFAAGYRGVADHAGTFVWADSTVGEFTSTGEDQFLVRAKGGVGIQTAYPRGTVSVTRRAQKQGFQLELRNEGSITAPNYDGIRFTQATLPSDTPTNLAWIKAPYQNFGGADMELGLRFHDEPILYLKNMGNVVGTPVRVGVGTASPSVELDVNGDIKAVSLTETSDARYKRGVTDLPNALETVSKLRGVRYYWNREAYPEKTFEDGPQLGFLAQEVREIVPEVVSEDDSGSLSLAYGKLVPLLVEAIKEQQARIQALEAEMSELQSTQ